MLRSSPRIIPIFGQHRRRHRQPQARSTRVRNLIIRILTTVARIAKDFIASHLVKSNKDDEIPRRAFDEQTPGVR